MKILIIRFSSIGDVILTTPVIRCLKKQLPNIEIHYVTKISNKSFLETNPYIHKLIYLEDDLSAVALKLKEEKYDLVIDLHKNLRTLRLKLKLGVKSISFDKLNWPKWLLVNFKKYSARIGSAISVRGNKNSFQCMLNFSALHNLQNLHSGFIA